jgi:hypothetical protein
VVNLIEYFPSADGIASHTLTWPQDWTVRRKMREQVSSMASQESLLLRNISQVAGRVIEGSS